MSVCAERRSGIGPHHPTWSSGLIIGLVRAGLVYSAALLFPGTDSVRSVLIAVYNVVYNVVHM